MNHGAMQRRWARGAAAALIGAVLAESTACNAISGADRVDFTGKPRTSSATGMDAGGMGAGGMGAGGMGAGGMGAGGMGAGGMGATSVVVKCTDGKGVVVGVRVRGEAWLNQFDLICSDFQADGHTGGNTYSAGPDVGGTAGTPVEKYCDYPKNGVQLRYTLDAEHVYQVQLGCSSPETWKSTDTVEQWLDPVGGAAAGPQMGGQGACPKGFALSYMKVHLNEDGQSIHDFSDEVCFRMP